MKMGRPTELTPDVHTTIVEALRKGMYREPAARLAGVCERTLYNWLERGALEEEGIYVDFVDALKAAEAEAEGKLLDEIRTARPGLTGVSGADVWQAKAWIMERRWPKRWAARVRTAVTEELDRFTDRLAKKLDEATYRKVMDASREDAPSEGASGAAH